MFKVIYRKRAENQIENIVEWYFGKNVGTAVKFINELDYLIDLLSINPYFATKYLDVKCVPFKKFPYLIFYRIDEKKMVVRIISVIHTSRNPSKVYPK